MANEAPVSWSGERGELLRQFQNGDITSDEFVEALRRLSDKAINCTSRQRRPLAPPMINVLEVEGEDENNEDVVRGRALIEDYNRRTSDRIIAESQATNRDNRNVLLFAGIVFFLGGLSVFID